MVKVREIRVDKGVHIAYEHEDADYVIKSPERGIDDFYKSITFLTGIFAKRANLQKQDEVIVTGVERGDDQQGDWYRLSGSYKAHGVTYKVKGDKLRPVPKGVPLEHRASYEANNFGTIVTASEIADIENALLHGVGYVNGERKSYGVQELPFDDAEEVE